MAKQSHIVSINFTGGIISPGYLREVLEIASAVQVTQVRFGLRVFLGLTGGAYVTGWIMYLIFG